jgi:hypothetical protein
MKQPPGFENNNYVYKLHKNLYGLKQAAHDWNKTLTQVLINEGFLVNPADHCLFSKSNKNDVCYVLMHVDDLLIVSNKTHKVRKIAS